MLTEAEKRAARLAVSRYGARQTIVDEAVGAVLRARGQGKSADLYDTLLRQRAVTPPQAAELRASLDATLLDPNAPHAPPARTRERAAPGDNSTPREAIGELRSLGEYRILRPLGEGGMGSVYLAYQESEAREVAIKILADHLADNQPSVDRFYREAKSGALLNHPNIVRNLSVGQDRATGKHYLVLEFVDGPSAHTLLTRYGRLAVADAVHITLEVARALEHAHSRNVVHRDIKPDNILITRSGVAKLADLGLAKRTDETSHLTATRQGFGTPYYMPYEQAMNAKYADGRSDIFALGATLYHLVCGQVPFPGINHLEILDRKNLGLFPPASSVNPDVPRALDRILEKMLARDPQDRYQTASEVIVDLERSGLAARVPSFADQELALQDPVVRQRLANAAQPTCPDVRAPSAGEAAPASDLWYLRYRDRHGKVCKARATTAQLVQRIRAGRMGQDTEASRDPTGDFRPLRLYAEFREVRARSQPSPRQSLPPCGGAVAVARPWWLAVAVGVGLVTLSGLVLAKLLWTV